MDETLNCTIKTIGASATRQVTLSYGDGKSDTFNLSSYMPYGYYFNYSIPTGNITGLTGAPAQQTYYLPNTEFKYDGAIQAVQIYALTAGNVTISVSVNISCPDLSAVDLIVFDGLKVVMMYDCPNAYTLAPCAPVLGSITYCPNLTMSTVIAQRNVSKGYNSIGINNFQVLKGAFLMITTTAEIAIDPLASTYQDVYQYYPFSCPLASIGPNRRLMVNFIYQPTLIFPFSHAYSIPDVYTLMARIPGSLAVQSLDASVNPRKH